jgi:endoglucanase
MRTPISPASRDLHHRWLLELTQIPTAAGREHRVIAWIEHWLAERPHLTLSRDNAGNLHISSNGTRAGEAGRGGPPIYFTAHLDHPAFVVERLISADVVQVQFRGGVMDDYFVDARITIHNREGESIGATLTGITPALDPATKSKSYLAKVDRSTSEIEIGSVAAWELPKAEIRDGIIHTNACDDLAAAAAALAAYDVLRGEPHAHPTNEPKDGGLDVRLLFTRAEEIGFIGAIAASRERTMPIGSRVLALENSRSFDDSPIGGGPIVRVGDRLSIFTPALTGAIAKRAEEIAGGPASPAASQKQSSQPAWKWQRKLMAGGACEATVFCAFGYQATCICLPLGNYHNMADLTAVQAGKNTATPRVGREFVSVADFDGLVDLLVGCGERLPESGAPMSLIEKLWRESASVLSS